jgi:hypothetical protein
MVRNARRCTHATERMTGGSDGASPYRLDLKLFSFDVSNQIVPANADRDLPHLIRLIRRFDSALRQSHSSAETPPV